MFTNILEKATGEDSGMIENMLLPVGPEICDPDTATFQDVDVNNVASHSSGTGFYNILSDGTFISFYWSGVLTIGSRYRLTASEVSGTGAVELQAPAHVIVNGVYNFTATGTLLQIKRNAACDVDLKLSVREII